MFTPCNGPPLCFKPPYAGKTPSESSGSLLIASTPINANNARRCQLLWEALTPERQHFDFFLPLQHTPKRKRAPPEQDQDLLLPAQIHPSLESPGQGPSSDPNQGLQCSPQHPARLLPLAVVLPSAGESQDPSMVTCSSARLLLCKKAMPPSCAVTRDPEDASQPCPRMNCCC